MELLYGSTQGHVYSPTVDKYKTWKEHWFKWPKEKPQLLEHLQKHSQHDLYITPALFKFPKLHRNFFLQSQYLFCDFDGNAPTTYTIAPHIKIRSSQPGHEHWYWRLDEPCRSVEEFENYNRRLTTKLNADHSGWEYCQVLRPPNTHNHKRDLPVRAVDERVGQISLQDFKYLPDLPSSAKIKVDVRNVPTLQETLAKYRFNLDCRMLLSEEIYRPHRSDALFKLGVYLAEASLTDDEMYVVLKDTCARWGKFCKDDVPHAPFRSDIDKRVSELIANARGQVITKTKNPTPEKIKKEAAAKEPEVNSVYAFKDFMNTNVKFEWLIEDLMPMRGSGVIFGPSGIGKSTLVLRMLIAIALGKPLFLDKVITRQQKVLFVSLEMQHDELKQFLEDMNLEPEEIETLQQNFFLWPVGHAVPFDKIPYQKRLLEFIDANQIELVCVDSLQTAMSGSVSSDDDVRVINTFFNNHVRKKRNCGYLFVHHPRKPGKDSTEPQDFNDMFGSSYITNNAQSVLMMYRKGTRVGLQSTKRRHAWDNSEILLMRKPDRSFEIVRTKDRKEASDQRRDDENAEHSGLFGLLGS